MEWDMREHRKGSNIKNYDPLKALNCASSSSWRVFEPHANTQQKSAPNGRFRGLEDLGSRNKCHRKMQICAGVKDRADSVLFVKEPAMGEGYVKT